MTYTHHYDSPLGGITMASDGEALTGLWFDGQKYFAAGIGSETEEKNLPVFEQTDRWLDIYFQGKEPDFTPKLALMDMAPQKEELRAQIDKMEQMRDFSHVKELTIYAF